MPILGWIRYYREQNKERKIRELILAKGFSESFTNLAESALFYTTLSEREKVKFCKNIYKNDPSITREALEEKFNSIILALFQHLEIVELVVGNKREAAKVHQRAVALLEEYRRSP